MYFEFQWFSDTQMLSYPKVCTTSYVNFTRIGIASAGTMVAVKGGGNLRQPDHYELIGVGGAPEPHSARTIVPSLRQGTVAKSRPSTDHTAP